MKPWKNETVDIHVTVLRTAKLGKVVFLFFKRDPAEDNSEYRDLQCLEQKTREY